MNDAQRVKFLKQIRLIRSQLDTLSGKVSRFERLLTPHNILDNHKTTTKLAKHTATAVTKPPKKDVKVSGRVPRDPMFDLEIEFDDNGDGYGNPLVNPVANKEYYVRCRLRQHQAEPLVQGFKLAWTKPSGWTWMDGLGQNTTDEAICNPVIVTRVAKAPGSARGGKFRIVVLERYQ